MPPYFGLSDAAGAVVVATGLVVVAAGGAVVVATGAVVVADVPQAVITSGTIDATPRIAQSSFFRISPPNKTWCP